MNNKGQQIIVSLMIAVMIFILVIILSPPLIENITAAKNTTYLNESNPDLPIENKATIIVLDLMIFYYIGIIIAASLVYITGKRTMFDVVTAIVVFMAVVVMITPIKSLIILARDSDHLNCGVTTISTGTKLACIITDLWLFYLVVSVIAVAISYIFVSYAVPKIRGGG